MKESENEFDSLRRLLTLKRHETPPPGYFEHFSDQVLFRIRAGETGAAEGAWEGFLGETSWLVRLLQTLQAKPAFVGGFASVLCSLLVFGVIYSSQPEGQTQSILPVLANNTGAFGSTGSPLSHAPDPMMLTLNSSNSVLTARVNTSPSLFDQIQLVAQPASFTPEGN